MGRYWFDIGVPPLIRPEDRFRVGHILEMLEAVAIDPAWKAPPSIPLQRCCAMNDPSKLRFYKSEFVSLIEHL